MMNLYMLVSILLLAQANLQSQTLPHPYLASIHAKGLPPFFKYLEERIKNGDPAAILEIRELEIAEGKVGAFWGDGFEWGRIANDLLDAQLAKHPIPTENMGLADFVLQVGVRRLSPKRALQQRAGVLLKAGLLRYPDDADLLIHSIRARQDVGDYYGLFKEYKSEGKAERAKTIQALRRQVAEAMFKRAESGDGKAAAWLAEEVTPLGTGYQSEASIHPFARDPRWTPEKRLELLEACALKGSREAIRWLLWCGEGTGWLEHAVALHDYRIMLWAHECDLPLLNEGDLPWLIQAERALGTNKSPFFPPENEEEWID